MKIRPYLTFDGNCEEAIELYKRAFKVETLKVLRFADVPANPNFPIPEVYQNRIMQATIAFGEDFIRLSDCGPGHKLNDSESERISLAIETGIEEVKVALQFLRKMVM